MYNTHNLQRPFMCELCGSSFSQKSKLELHTRRHSNIRPYKCKEEGCMSSFKQLTDLKTHMACIHSDLRPFSCEICGQTFKIKNSLRAHRRNMHTKKNMVRCTECDKLLLTVSALNDHISVYHRGERNFKCQICINSYSRASHLRRHLSDSHRTEYDEMLSNGVFKRTRRNLINPYYDQTPKKTIQTTSSTQIVIVKSS